jgi:hypothetical protein
VLDDGSLLYSIAPAGKEGSDRWTAGQVVRLRPGQATPEVLVEGGSDPRYLASGHLLYQSSGRLLARTFDPRSGQMGNPTVVIDGVMRGGTPLGAGTAWYDVSENGTLIYMPGPVGGAELHIGLAWFERGGKAETLPIPNGPYAHPRLSRDGRSIVFTRIDNGEHNLYVYGLGTGGAPRRLTFGGRDRFPIWSADSQWVIFSGGRDAEAGLYRQRADGTGAAERLTSSPKDIQHVPESASPDGAALLFSAVGANSADLTLYAFKDRTSVPVPGGRSGFKTGAEFSPDGKWIAYANRESPTGPFVAYVRPYPLTGTRYQISSSSGDGHSPAWSPDGREVFLTPGPGQLLNSVRITTTPSFVFAPGEPVARLFLNVPPYMGRPFDVSGGATRGGAGTDGSVRFLGLTRPMTGDSASAREEIRVVLNWVEELKGRVK